MTVLYFPVIVGVTISVNEYILIGVWYYRLCLDVKEMQLNSLAQRVATARA
jgi:hypothetical protein